MNNQEKALFTTMGIFILLIGVTYALPTITITLPENKTYSNSSIVAYEVSSDEAIQTWEYTYNGTNITFTTNGTINFSPGGDGAYNLTFFAENNTGTGNLSQDSVVLTIDTTDPTVSGVKFFARNGSNDIIGIDETSFNNTNLLSIESMLVTFTVEDVSGIFGDITIFYTANGTSSCALGNNQSTTCYNWTNPESTRWIEFKNGSITSTFDDSSDGHAQGDNITCSFIAPNSTAREYTCILDEHYNPNVAKRYPLNFSDIKFQDGNDFRIAKDNLWKFNIENPILPVDAHFYKFDIRVQAINNPTQPLFLHICNSSYTTGDPELSPNCALVVSVTEDDLQDDGTKLRGIFTDTLISTLNEITIGIIDSDTPQGKYYALRTACRLDGQSSTGNTQTSTDKGTTYSNFSDVCNGGHYDSDANLNWLYNNTASTDPTQFIMKVEVNDTLGNIGNSSNFSYTWLFEETLDLPPVVDIISPVENANVSGIMTVSYTAADPNGDSFLTNVTLTNQTDTFNISLNTSDSITSVNFDTSTVANGDYNLTIISFENETADELSGTETHQITIDNQAPTVTIDQPTNITIADTTPNLNAYASDDLLPIDSIFYSVNDTANITSSGTPLNTTLSILPDGTHDVRVCANDSVGNEGCSQTHFTVYTTYEYVNIFINVHTVVLENNLFVHVEFNENFDFNTTIDSITVDTAVNTTERVFKYTNSSLLTLGWHNITVFYSQPSLNNWSNVTKEIRIVNKSYYAYPETIAGEVWSHANAEQEVKETMIPVGLAILTFGFFYLGKAYHQDEDKEKRPIGFLFYGFGLLMAAVTTQILTLSQQRASLAVTITVWAFTIFMFISGVYLIWDVLGKFTKTKNPWAEDEEEKDGKR